MSKLTNILAGATLAAGLVLGLGASDVNAGELECSRSNVEYSQMSVEEGSPSFVYRPAVIHGSIENLGKQLAELFKDEFDKVSYHIKCAKYDDSAGECGEWNLVVRGHEEVNGVYFPRWGINVHTTCHSYTMYNKGLAWLVGEDLCTEANDGSVNCIRLKKKTAEKAADIFGTRAKMNTDNCGFWIKVLGDYGPLGPGD